MPRDGRGLALFTHCRTPLIDTFRDRTGAAFRTEGTRAVLFDDVEDLDGTALAPLILGALTYHERTS
ncbi:hypothetical protein [Maritimibacter sp. DP1N21-5]|uniref:hypothetical protein n=1 Tax=Maritimibacter sp. DP1N21-5 TaxID=2836867 RepID=UPI001C490204|nr:hypothetical protein [Maritimibacter sp. DP1N21-5]MBV7408387.1 hypothetical protein [Maritimibacter sp. DP1N21-5]